MFGAEGLFNLRSVINEIGVINGNLTGVNRTGYKQASHHYGDSGSTSGSGALQTPDSTLITDHTAINFGQGQIISTGEETDLAISGEGFFLLQKPSDIGVNPPDLLTRDGHFRFSNVSGFGDILTDNRGNAVLMDSSGTGAGPFVAISKADFQNNDFRPTVVKPADEYSSMKYSKHGATVFEFTGGIQLADGIVKNSSLESANVDAQESLVAMSLASKKFQAMAVQIKNEQTLLDTVMGLIK